MKRLRTRVAVFALIVIVGLVVDRLSKLWALSALQYGKQIVCIPNSLMLSLVRNGGASFGLGSGLTSFISIVAILACVAMLAAVRRTKSLQWTIVLSLAFSGAFGNLIDRAIYAEHFFDGKVVDFINYGWSVGNVADIILAIAGIWFVGLILFETPFKPGESDDESSGESAGESASENTSENADENAAENTSEVTVENTDESNN
ncbi:signal peptidase II [Gardnerella greenwoodii]|uniref:Lipoprotein signal peptidase n=1 Tax=Gardnerella greenwoodii 00703Dmash TaxID=698960 RepID=I4M6G7_9BIFI|nr:signal peptidase II [Gardnerella greenwoodii]EIK84807.1 lipoprotein signal peptidase [Gardnerella greenwoodii 00703Dmash]